MIPIGTEITVAHAGDHQRADERVRGAAALADHAAGGLGEELGVEAGEPLLTTV